MKKLVFLVGVLALATATAFAVSKGAGTVKVTNPSLVLEFTFKGMKEKLDINGKGLTIPENTYTPETFSILAKAKDGTIWTIHGSKPTGPLANFTVEKGKTTEFDLGPTLNFVVTVYRAEKDRKTGKTIVPIGFTVQGKMGEFYSPAIMAGTKTVPAPYFQILDGNNKLLLEGQFAYG